MIASILEFIANYLNLENPEQYTGHCFRRSAAIVLADSGASMSTMKRQFRWRSSTMAEGYISQSKKYKMDVAKSLPLRHPQKEREKRISYFKLHECGCCSKWLLKVCNKKLLLH